jgi:adenosylmethionine---8-amino-7-oxononanoate aminotransferase
MRGDRGGARPRSSNLRDVRVQGAIGVVELDRIDDLGALRRRFIEAGVFVRPIRNIVYLTPAFTIGEEDLDCLRDARRKFETIVLS